MVTKITKKEAQAAVETLLKWACDNPKREGLVKTPHRVAKAYQEFFAGYTEDPKEILKSASYHSAGYEDMVILRNIRFESHCEHHISPILGTLHLAYIPKERVVGISKLARVCDVFTKRLQIQEALTAQIGSAIHDALQPHGVAVVAIAQHQCMTTRGVYKTDMDMVTRYFSGDFKSNPQIRSEFLQTIFK